MLGGADNPNGELPSYITGADIQRSLSSYEDVPVGHDQQ
ncbi:InsB [Shigella sonnei]|nr:InsB [Shigella sonnei]SRS35365.1 InsB [Shigella sonnei]SVI85854.1 InsB [Shigella sonnei]